jgi:hypothetical protein
MQELFIPYTKNPLLAELTTTFEAVCQARDLVSLRISELKTRRGERIGSKGLLGLRDKVTRERERAYDVASIRLELAADELFEALRALHKACGLVKDAAVLEGDAGAKLLDIGVEKFAARNNVLCAIDVVDQACALHHEAVIKQLRKDRFLYGGIACAFALVDEREDPREYVAQYAGFGRPFRFDEGDGTCVPQGPYLTLSEAKAAASAFADDFYTIGWGSPLFVDSGLGLRRSRPLSFLFVLFPRV